MVHQHSEDEGEDQHGGVTVSADGRTARSRGIVPDLWSVAGPVRGTVAAIEAQLRWGLRRFTDEVADRELRATGGREAIIGEQQVPYRSSRWTTLEPDPTSETVLDHPVRDAVLEDVRETFEGDGTPFLDPPGEPFLEHRLFDFGYLDVAEVLDWEWVNEPFAYVAIVRESGDDKLRYLVQEPTLDEFERYVLRDLQRTVRNKLLYRGIDAEDDREALFERQLEEIVQNHAAAIADDGTLHKLLYYIRRDFVHLGPVDPIMRDDQIEDVSCDGDDIPLFVYRFDHRDLQTNVGFESAEELRRFVLRLANQAGEQVSVSNPLVDGSLPDGSRVQLSFGGEISTRGANFTIRKFANVPYTPIQLIDWGTFSVEQMAYFWLAIENNRSLIFAGGTGSGKTTSMNAVSFFIPENSKVVSIEDTREITLPHDNWVQHVTRDSLGTDTQGEVEMYDLLKASLRQRPEYLLVGEIRTDSRVAFTFFQAIGTGHTAYTTLHADSISGVLNRLENEPLNVSKQMLMDLDIVSIQTQAFEDGERVRRNETVTELVSLDEAGDINGVDVFARDAERDEINQRADSEILQDVAHERGWSDLELARELQVREELLEYLLDNGIDGYREVTAVIDTFRNRREALMDRIQAGELTASDVRGSTVVLDEPTASAGGALDAAETPDGDVATPDAGERSFEEADHGFVAATPVDADEQEAATTTDDGSAGEGSQGEADE